MVLADVCDAALVLKAGSAGREKAGNAQDRASKDRSVCFFLMENEKRKCG